MRTLTSYFLIGFFILFSSVALSDTPEKMAEQYYQHIKSGDWLALSNMMHPEATKALKQALIPMFEMEATQNRKLIIEKVYGTGATVDSAKKDSDKTFFQQSIKNISKMLRNQQFKLEGFKVLGKVTEDDKTTHIVVRETMLAGSLKMEELEVFTFIKEKDGWKLALSGKLANFVQTARFTTSRSK